MSTEKAILIASSSLKAIDSDVNKLAELITDVTNMAERKLNADFMVDVVSDIPSLFNKNDCRHVLGILVPGSEKYVNLDGSDYIPKNSVIKCARCGIVFSLFRTASEIREVVHPDQLNGIDSVTCIKNHNNKVKEIK